MANGTYVEYAFRDRVLAAISAHDPARGPLYLQYDPHIAHCPLQVPAEWLARFNFSDDEAVCRAQTARIFPGSGPRELPLPQPVQRDGGAAGLGAGRGHGRAKGGAEQIRTHSVPPGELDTSSLLRSVRPRHRKTVPPPLPPRARAPPSTKTKERKRRQKRCGSNLSDGDIRRRV